jgi:hypothetical protein
VLVLAASALLLYTCVAFISDSSANWMQGRVHYHNGFWIVPSQLMTELFVWNSLSFPCGTPQSSIWQILNDFAECWVGCGAFRLSVCDAPRDRLPWCGRPGGFCNYYCYCRAREIEREAKRRQTLIEYVWCNLIFCAPFCSSTRHLTRGQFSVIFSWEHQKYWNNDWPRNNRQ